MPRLRRRLLSPFADPRGVAGGIVSATWATFGIVGVASIVVVVFGERLDPAAVVGLGLVLAGVYCLDVVSDAAAH